MITGFADLVAGGEMMRARQPLLTFRSLNDPITLGRRLPALQ